MKIDLRKEINLGSRIKIINFLHFFHLIKSMLYTAH